MRLSDWPSLRLVIPLTAGIIIWDTVKNTWAALPDWCLITVVVTLITITLLYRDSKPRLSGLCLSLAFVTTGLLAYKLQLDERQVEWPETRRYYHGTLTDYPVERERSYRLDVKLSDTLYCGNRIYLYVPKDSSLLDLEPGYNISFYGQIDKPSSDGLDFDYERYLLNHGISGTLYVQASRWTASPPHGKVSPVLRSKKLRHKALSKYKKWELDGNAYAVVAAVTLGDKKELDNSLREIYSTTGVSHVLAVSGLHVGIMCWFLYIVFPAFMFRRIRWLRELLVLSIMWAYAFMIGLPVSITRSLIMFTLVVACRTIGRESSVLNSIGVAALFILAVNPSALFDMSFQLSFTAVLFIVLLTPVIQRQYEPRTGVGRYVWNATAVSIAAQIGTAPLVMFHFSGFSTYFLFANLLVVPIMFVVVSLAVSLWIVGWIAPICRVIVALLTWIIERLTSLLTYASLLPYSHLEIRIESAVAVFMVYVVILWLYLWIEEKRTHRLVQLLGVMAIMSFVAWCRCFQ